ncbi:MAG: amidohydrolase family protein [Clostridia bacterium]|nr:amidohydrolase family protein [Clostridia bacterium]
MKVFLSGGAVLTPEGLRTDLGVLVESGRILALLPKSPQDAEFVDLEGNTLVPTFIELHCHGGEGYEFVDGTEEAILGAARIHAEHGTGVLYPTISASDYETTYRALEALEAVRDRLPLTVPGVHLEGPYLSPEMCGAQDPGIVRKPDPKEYRALYERFGSLIARWDYAPEVDEGGAFLDFLREKGILAATAHSAAKYSHLLPAYEKGNRLVTHLYSCTSTVTREGGFRKLGIIETTFLLEGMVAEVIGDGCHLPPELLRMIYSIKGADRLCLISDAIRYAGLGERKNAWEGKIPYVIEDGVAKLADRSAFAGSIATADQLLQRTVAAGISLADTVKMMTATPARVMGLSDYGAIAPGYRARFNLISPSLTVTPLVP